MSQQSRTFPALTGEDASALNRALSAGDVTVFVDGTALRLPAAARDAVLELLSRLAAGSAVTLASASPDGAKDPVDSPAHNPLLTTSQAAAAAGISHTYLRNLTDAGILPVEYRGTHRRIRMSDVEAWLKSQRELRAAKAAAQGGDVTSGGTDT
ncbi:helix-turn-helix domain-containing protein [Arthrobacter gandavensis]|uniref:helix-turn-helix domain-containing protein n=1 Tax=Arthrobacter gandavensis TaxID=169960 RepID=UPI00189032DB|nr:helix-turn-helix domain-containing protein [Arthrobacter gandavensis]MBF4994459.1 helix-turn-helix domain-containing protein [Arthrobacter gandavensis]